MLSGGGSGLEITERDNRVSIESDAPPSPITIVARVPRRAQLNLSTTNDGAITVRDIVGDLELDLLTRAAKRSGTDIELQPREFRLLEYLMRHAGQVVTRTMLLENVWDLHFDPQTNVIDVHMSRLRAVVDKGFATPLIHTVRGAGYILRDES